LFGESTDRDDLKSFAFEIDGVKTLCEFLTCDRELSLDFQTSILRALGTLSKNHPESREQVVAYAATSV